ncbi:MAG: hypothetical protein ACLVKO_06915 [Dysgonomonas sp.]
MKKLLYLLFILPFLAVSCGDDDNDDPKQDYTSFQVKNEAKEGVYRNVVAGTFSPWYGKYS